MRDVLKLGFIGSPGEEAPGTLLWNVSVEGSFEP